MSLVPPAADAAAAVPLLDRDHSILAFNERVFDWARRDDVPLLERLRYLCIVSSNLDEFFEVRAAAHLDAAGRRAGDAAYAPESFRALSDAVHGLVERQYALFNEVLQPALEREGIKIVSHGERDAEQRRWVHQYFEREVRPLLAPTALDPAHPFPLVANKSLNFIVQLTGLDAFGRENDIAIVKVPRVLPRLIRLPDKRPGRRTQVVLLSSVIRAHLAELFPGRQVGQFSQFRVTRHSDLAIDEEEVDDLRTALRQGLEYRHYGQAARLEVSASCDPRLSDFLLQQFKLSALSLYRVHGPVNLGRLAQLIDLADAPRLLFPEHQPAWPRGFPVEGSMFERLREGDVLVHQPFESFEAVPALLREAVHDPDVLAVRQTIYRTGSDPELMGLLREAVRRGKEVMVVVELKARFDEEANINWAEMLEGIGAQVVYGVVGLKTHAKMLLITRREGRRLRRYGHLSTGNYNPRTARLYTDLSYFTADPALTADMEQVFVHIAGQSRLAHMARLLVAPFHLQKAMLERVAAMAAAAAAGRPARIIVKANALTDEQLVRALLHAGQQGVRIDLVVRGACVLPAQLPGVSDNIRVRSVVGRFLEHTRVFYFRDGEDEQLYLSSADWMSRNMLRRIEVAWPVDDPALRQRVIDECLVPYLHDGCDAWALGPDGRYVRADDCAGPDGQRHSAQQALVLLHAKPRSA
ncbi:polyphosphate kinase 1 [Pseudorhodoferax sp.]|uniref:polyphosphate kinase 1 n=1 Tax=Pseudorhodoferax sp. TaxID=1993553 RepID=UPI0039E351A0